MDKTKNFVEEMSAIHGDLIGLGGILSAIMETASRGTGNFDAVSDAITGASSYLRSILDHMDHVLLNAPEGVAV